MKFLQEHNDQTYEDLRHFSQSTCTEQSNRERTETNLSTSYYRICRRKLICKILSNVYHLFEVKNTEKQSVLFLCQTGTSRPQNPTLYQYETGYGFRSNFSPSSLSDDLTKSSKVLITSNSHFHLKTIFRHPTDPNFIDFKNLLLNFSFYS